MNKRGSEIVEAAIVVPIFILILSALITLGVFYFDGFNNQCRVQSEIVEEMKATRLPMKKISNSETTFANIVGITTRLLSVDYSTYAFAIDEAMIIRTGELAGLR